jgi:hypothetical protein
MLSWQVSLTVFFVSKAMMSLKTSLAGAATAIGLTALAYPAQSAQFSLSYVDPGNNISFSGILTGTATGNIINITGFSNLVYNGVALPFSTSSGGMVDSYFTASGNPPQASFDGSVMDFMLYDDMGTDNVGFGLSSVPGFGLAFTSSITQVTVPNDLGGAEVPFDPSNMMWEAALIPEPGAVVGLLGLGLGALASKVIKKG